MENCNDVVFRKAGTWVLGGTDVELPKPTMIPLYALERDLTFAPTKGATYLEWAVSNFISEEGRSVSRARRENKK
jgi:hypothetical protein